jgi:hypothetical protein
MYEAYRVREPAWEPADGLRVEHAWGASVLLARLLAVATPPASRLADLSIEQPALASLKQRALVVEIFGRIKTPLDEPALDAEDPALSLSPGETEILKRIFQEQIPDRDLRLSLDDASRLREAHAAAFPGTPTLTQLMHQGALTQVDGDLELRLVGRGGAWGETLVRAAALFWEDGLRADRSDTMWLRAWLDRVETISDWGSAPRAMLPEARERFLDAAMEVLLAEPDLRRSWQDEESRLRTEKDVPFSAPRRVRSELPLSATPLARYRRYERAFRHLRDLRGLRDELTSLMSAVVQNDSLAGAPNARCRRIRELIRAGDERPFLAYWVPWLVVHARPGAIAWCLYDDTLAALGAALVMELEIAEECTHIGGIERTRRHFEQRIAAWEGATRVLFAETSVEREPAIAAFSSEILQWLASDAVPHEQPSEYQQEQQRLAAAALERFVDALRTATCSLLVHPGGGRQYRPKLLPYVAKPIFEAIGSVTSEERALVRFPLGTLQLLATWLDLVGEARLSPSTVPDNQIPTQREVALALLRLYRQELGREVQEIERDGERTLEPVVAAGDEQSPATLPWGTIAMALERNDAEALLQPVDFGTRIRAIPEKSAGVARAANDLRQAWASKLRTHLRILITAHQGMSERAEHQELRARLEVAIIERLSSNREDIPGGTLRFFERYGRFSEGVNELATATAKALNRFSDARRADAYAAWIDALADIGLLVAALPSIRPAAAREHASRRVAALAKGDFVASEVWLTHLQRIAQDAVVAVELELAERILDYGATATVGHPLRADWEEFEYRTRASIALARKDRAAFEALPLR